MLTAERCEQDDAYALSGSFKLNPEAKVFTPGCPMKGRLPDEVQVPTVDAVYDKEGYQAGELSQDTTLSGPIMDFSNVLTPTNADVPCAKAGSVWTDRALRSCDKQDKDEPCSDPVAEKEAPAQECKGLAFAFNPNAKSFDYDMAKQPTGNAMIVNVPCQPHHNNVQQGAQMTKIAGSVQNGTRRVANMRSVRYNDENRAYNDEESKHHYDRRNDNHNHHQYNKRDQYRDTRSNSYANQHSGYGIRTHAAHDITITRPKEPQVEKEAAPEQSENKENEQKKMSWAAMVARPKTPKATSSVAAPKAASMPVKAASIAPVASAETPVGAPSLQSCDTPDKRIGEDKSDVATLPLSTEAEPKPVAQAWTVVSKGSRSREIVPAIRTSFAEPKKVIPDSPTDTVLQQETADVGAGKKQEIVDVGACKKQETADIGAGKKQEIVDVVTAAGQEAADKSTVAGSKQETADKIPCDEAETAARETESLMPRNSEAILKQMDTTPSKQEAIKQESTHELATLPKQDTAPKSFRGKGWKHEVPSRPYKGPHPKVHKPEIAPPMPTEADFPAFPSCTIAPKVSEDVPVAQSWAARAQKVAEVPKHLSRASSGTLSQAKTNTPVSPMEKPDSVETVEADRSADGETEECMLAKRGSKAAKLVFSGDGASLDTTRDTESKREEDDVSAVEEKEDMTGKNDSDASGKSAVCLRQADAWDDKDTVGTVSAGKIPVVEECSSPYTASPSTDDNLSEDSFVSPIIRFDREFLYSLRHEKQCMGPCPPDVPQYIRIGYEDKNTKKKVSKTKTSGPAPKLVQSDSAWGARRQEEVDDTTKFVRKIKSLLNKLTIEKFDSLLPQILESGITEEKHVQILMTEVFEKATTQHHFVHMYTNLCTNLDEYLNENNICQGENKFKRILLLECQLSFRKNMEPLEVNPDDDKTEVEQLHKMRMLGNMKFIGQLSIHKMLRKRTIFSCTRDLLDKHTDDALETLCTFMLEIGPEFDNDNFGNYATSFNEVFQEMKCILDEPDVKTRTQCLIRDVLDMRESKWRGKLLKQQPPAPATLNEVKKEWEETNGVLDGDNPSKPSRSDSNSDWNLQKSYSDWNLKKTKSSSMSKIPYSSQTSGLSTKSNFTASTSTPIRKKLSLNDNSFSVRSESTFSLNLTATATDGCLRPGGLQSRLRKDTLEVPDRFSCLSSSARDESTEIKRSRSSIEPSVSAIAESPEPEKPALASLGVPDSSVQMPTPSSPSSEGIRNYGLRRTRSELDKPLRREKESSMRLGDPSKSSWAAARKEKLSDDAKFIGKMKSILNKLTIEKYDSLYIQLQDLGFRKVSQIRELTEDLFCKATTQHHFIEMYTRLCLEFNKWWQAEGQDGCEIDVIEEVPEKADGKRTNYFKSVLLNKCQDVFEHLNEKPAGLEEIGSEEERLEAQFKLKERMLGNVKFIGQLLIHKLLGTRILVLCATSLWEIQSADSLETLTAFLHTVGPVFDARDFKHIQDLDKIFDDMQKMVDDKKVSTRIHALLSDVLDRRASKWHRIKHQTTGPQSLSEVKQQWGQDYKIKEVKEDVVKPENSDNWQQAKGKRPATRPRR